MTPVRFRRWLVSADADATRKAHAQMPSQSAETCGCTPCLNFAAMREQIYPPEIRRLFEELGVDYRHEVEVLHYGRLRSGQHSYGAWFHFVGHIEQGKDAAVPKGKTSWTFDLERITERFSLGFTANAHLIPEALVGKPVVQINIDVDTPWVILDEEPD